LQLSLIAIFVDLTTHLAVLVSVMVIYSLLARRMENLPEWGRAAVGGTIFGLAAIFVMLTPIEVNDGVYFDMRSVILALTGPFAGPAAAVVAALLAVGYRLALGGIGVYPGVVGISLASLLGIGLSAYASRRRIEIAYRHLGLLSLLLVLHGVIIISLLPGWSYFRQTFQIWAPELLIFTPIGTILLGGLLIHERRRHELERALAESEERLQDYVNQIELSKDRLEEQSAELAALAEDLAAAKQRAEQASGAKSQFLANMSHELRTPLNAIIGFSDLIREEAYGAHADRRYAEYAAIIHDSGNHLLDLINDILDFSKVEAGQLTLHEERCEVAKVIESCARMVLARAARGNVTLRSVVPHGLPDLRADDRRLRQIVLNLVTNAIKYTPAGGRVEVSAGIDLAGNMEISVSDTGVGISDADQAKVMEAFVQVDSERNRSIEGTGLGLPLTRRLVELHGGTLFLKSKLGHGTTATALFPCERIVVGPVQAKSASG